jgi:hypothetical protein
MSDLVDNAIEAAGGMRRWREIETIDARLSLTGGLFNIKGLGGIENILMHVDTRRPAVDTSPYGGVGHVGHYTEEKTWITDGAGEVVEERVDPRARMLGAKMTDPWDRIGRLYFSSYALAYGSDFQKRCRATPKFRPTTSTTRACCSGWTTRPTSPAAWPPTIAMITCPVAGSCSQPFGAW